jgi:PAS domain-containing protein
MALFTSVAAEVDGLPSVLICGTDMTHQSEIQAQLRESEQHFRRLFENMRDVYYRTNAQGVVLHVGPGVRHVLGYDPQEIVGRTAESYYPQSSDTTHSRPPSRHMVPCPIFLARWCARMGA